MLVEDFEVAGKELKEAITTSDLCYKAEAIYYRAKVLLHNRELEQVLLHYNEGISLVEEQQCADNSEHKALLGEFYIEKAWFHIQEWRNLDEAQHCLSRIERFVGETDYTLRCKLSNAWAGLCKQQQNLEKELAYRFQALRVYNR